MSGLGLACALCARANPLMPQHQAVTQVGSLLVCGSHVDEAFEMNAERMLRPEHIAAIGDRIAKVTADIEHDTRPCAPESPQEDTDARP